MAEAVQRLARDKEQLQQIGRRAHVTAKDYSMAEYAVKFTALLDKTGAGPLRMWPKGRACPADKDFYGIHLPARPPQKLSSRNVLRWLWRRP
jgi:hypothetical protein